MFYADNAATTPVKKIVLESMWPYLTQVFGNPSSSHMLGERAADAVTEARVDIANILGVHKKEIIFTSGGTEANNLIIKGLALGHVRSSSSLGFVKNKIVISPLEHSSVRNVCEYLSVFYRFNIVEAPIDSSGIVNLVGLEEMLTPDTLLCSIMYANNEFGVVQPISDIGILCRSLGILFHSDAVQSATLRSLDVNFLQVDALSLSGHKIGAPKGIGVAYISQDHTLEPILHGGGQEFGLRSGTENVSSIVGMAKALQIVVAEREKSCRILADFSENFVNVLGFLVPQVRIVGSCISSSDSSISSLNVSERLESIVAITFPNLVGEVLLWELGEKNIFASSQSACSSRSGVLSPVFLALGMSEDDIRSTIRFSFSCSMLSCKPEDLARDVADVVHNIEKRFQK